MADQDHVIGLAGAIDARRTELADAVSRGQGERMRFRIEPIELSMQVVVTKQADGGSDGVRSAQVAPTTPPRPRP